MALTTRMLTPDTWDDFAALVESNNGVWGGCWCMGFHPGGSTGTRQGNRDAKQQLVQRGAVHQVLVYDEERCVGWCQFGTPPELPNIKSRRAYDAEAQDAPDWRIGCIFTNSKDRGNGIAAAAVQGALEEIKRAGGGMKEPVIVINADAQASHQSVVRVMEAAQAAGYGRITFTIQNTKSP